MSPDPNSSGSLQPMDAALVGTLPTLVRQLRRTWRHVDYTRAEWRVLDESIPVCGDQNGINVQTAAYLQAATDASLIHYAGLAPRIVCFGHVRENSHGYEVIRLSVLDHLLNTLIAFVEDWTG